MLLATTPVPFFPSFNFNYAKCTFLNTTLSILRNLFPSVKVQLAVLQVLLAPTKVVAHDLWQQRLNTFQYYTLPWKPSAHNDQIKGHIKAGERSESSGDKHFTRRAASSTDRG